MNETMASDIDAVILERERLMAWYIGLRDGMLVARSNNLTLIQDMAIVNTFPGLAEPELTAALAQLKQTIRHYLPFQEGTDGDL